jgi:Tfp pilus assembly protein PilN
MLWTNLSTRPFYNERLVHALIAAVAAVVLAVTTFNLSQAFVLSGRQAQLQSRVAGSDMKARALRSEAARVRGAINPRELEAATVAAREANAVIERRAFSWTDLFNRFEDTLPEDVRITSVRPRVDKEGVITVTVVVVARDVEGVNRFMENLEARGAFSSLMSREDFVNEDGLIQATLEGRYAPPDSPVTVSKGAHP